MSSCSAASRREAPPSTRAITRMRMSAEYAFGMFGPQTNQCRQTRPLTGPWEPCDSIRQEHALVATRPPLPAHRGRRSVRLKIREGTMRALPRAAAVAAVGMVICGHALAQDYPNRTGGSGLVGTRAFIKSPPDGYTLFLGHTGSISINPSLYANAGFDPRKDFAPIGLIASMPVALLAHPSFPAKTIGDVVAVAKTAGANFNIGTSAVGTGGYLTAELFKSVTGIDAAIIPYKGFCGRAGCA